MPNTAIAVVFVGAMVTVIVALDIAFFRGHFWPRLLLNIGVVLVFAAFYLRLFKAL